jgi:hypothetical protein
LTVFAEATDPREQSEKMRKDSSFQFYLSAASVRSLRSFIAGLPENTSSVIQKSEPPETVIKKADAEVPPAKNIVPASQGTRSFAAMILAAFMPFFRNPFHPFQ